MPGGHSRLLHGQTSRDVCSASRPSRRWGGRCHGRRLASFPQTSLVGRSSSQPSNQTLRVPLPGLPTTCLAVENPSCHHFPEHAVVPHGVRRNETTSTFQAPRPGLICEWLRAHSSGCFADQLTKYLLCRYCCSLVH